MSVYNLTAAGDGTYTVERVSDDGQAVQLNFFCEERAKQYVRVMSIADMYPDEEDGEE